MFFFSFIYKTPQESDIIPYFIEIKIGFFYIVNQLLVQKKNIKQQKKVSSH